MKCNALICSQSVITDKTTGQASIINIYEGIQSTLFPFQLPLSVFISTEKEADDPNAITINFKISLEEQALFNLPISVVFIDPAVKNNTTVNLQGLVIGQAGKLSFSVFYNDVELKRCYMTIENKPN